MATILNNTRFPMPISGRGFAGIRLALGVSQNSLAKELGVFAATLARWEASDEPLADEWRAKWQAALKACAARRMRDLARLGLRTSDLPTQGLGRLLALYTA